MHADEDHDYGPTKKINGNFLKSKYINQSVGKPIVRLKEYKSRKLNRYTKTNQRERKKMRNRLLLHNILY